MAEKSNKGLIAELELAYQYGIDLISGGASADDVREAKADLQKARAAVLARMAGPGEVVVQGWQARDTAPKDGTRFLARFVTGQVAIIKRHDVGGRYEAWVTDGQYPNLPAFTHWMPLPDIATRPQGGTDDAAA